jgi:hypothetical protein
MRLIILVFFIATNSIAYNGPKHAFATDGCKCYAEGKSFSPGIKKCIGDFEAICVAKTGIGDSV